MNIKQAIQSSANVIRVTEVNVGDVYKRFDTSYDDRMFYGIVKGVHNDGEQAIIEAIEYRTNFGDLDINIKVLTGAKDYTLFPATPDELADNLDGIVERKRKDIQRKSTEIAKLEAEIIDIENIQSGKMMADLKAMSYAELSQAEYNSKRAALGA